MVFANGRIQSPFLDDRKLPALAAHERPTPHYSASPTLQLEARLQRPHRYSGLQSLTPKVQSNYEAMAARIAGRP